MLSLLYEAQMCTSMHTGGIIVSTLKCVLLHKCIALNACTLILSIYYVLRMSIYCIIMHNTCTYTVNVSVAESVVCASEVDEFATSAILFCSDPPFDVDDIICILPTQEVNC